MLVLHLSDLHLSRYGETGTWSEAGSEDRPGEVLHVWERWQIEGLRSRRKNRPAKLRLVDPEGVVHKVRSWPKRGDDKAVDRLLALALERHETSAERLIESRPEPAELQALLRLDPANTNLRFLEMLEQVLRVEPELIVITGDLTDNGFGYGLVRHYLAPWIEQQRLLVVPGNHDTYDMIPRKGRKLRAAAKEKSFRAFAQDLGLTLGGEGAWIRRVEDVALVGLNSCKPPRTPLSASGKVSSGQLEWLESLGAEPELRTARLRIGLVHHHLLRMPFALGKRSPIEVGMRLRNAPEVMRTCTAAGLDILMHGHRHHGYMVQLPFHPMVVSSPSSTLGCKFARRDYVWVLDLDREHPHPLMHTFDGLRAGMKPGASLFNHRLDKMS
jgi:3',5'-cyclic AMP phosphodiesterase CpdA